jgi:hypothetical protein
MRGVNIIVPDTLDNLRSDCIYKTDEYEIKRWMFGHCNSYQRRVFLQYF